MHFGSKHTNETKKKMSLRARTRIKPSRPKTGHIINCLICNKEKYFSAWQFRRKGGKYCSHECRQIALKGKHNSPLTQFKKGNKTWNTGYTKETDPRIAQPWLGKKRWSLYKGDKIGYRALHLWVKKYRGTPTICEFCGKTENNMKLIHWANKSHEYKRDLNDWIRLCMKCHNEYDKDYRNAAALRFPNDPKFQKLI